MRRRTGERARRSPPPPAIRLERASHAHEAEFLAAVRRSVALHRPWVYPPATPERFRAYLDKQDGVANIGYFGFSGAGELVAVVNLNQIVRGALQSAFLGYYAFAPHARRGYMSAALARLIAFAFGKHRLHRVEANIQPGNRASIALVKRFGFRKEGYSPRSLKVGGRYRDHERWALTREDSLVR